MRESTTSTAIAQIVSAMRPLSSTLISFCATERGMFSTPQGIVHVQQRAKVPQRVKHYRCYVMENECDHRRDVSHIKLLSRLYGFVWERRNILENFNILPTLCISASTAFNYLQKHIK